MFKVNRIILKGFTGMGLHDIATFDLTVTTPTTIILGGNGSGKSSLLSVYLPVCPEKHDFMDGGSYVNHCEKDNVKYKCVVKRKGNSLSGSITNETTGDKIVENVNTRVYNAHISDLFGLTKEIKEILNGEVSFTSTKSATRKQWFTLLSTTDMSYAMSFYTKLRKHYNSLGNVIDHQTKKIAELKTRVIDDADEKKALEARLSAINEEIGTLNKALESKIATDENVTPERIVQQLRVLEKTANLILDEGFVIPTQEDIDARQASLLAERERVARLQGLEERLTKELAALTDEENRQAFLMKNHSGLRETIERLKQELETCRGKQWCYPELFNAERFNVQQFKQAVSYCKEFSWGLSTRVDALQTTDRLSSQEKLLATADVVATQLGNQLNLVNRVIDNLQHDRTHFLETSEVECPRCGHGFRPGVVRTLPSIDEELQKQIGYRNELTVELETHNRKRDTIAEEVNNLHGIKEIITGYSKDPVLSVLFIRLQEVDGFYSGRGKLSGLIDTFFQEVDEAVHFVEITARLEKAVVDWGNAAKLVGNVDEVLPQKIESCKHELNETTEVLLNGRRRIAEQSNMIEQLTTLKANVERFSANYDNICELIDISANNLLVSGLRDVREQKLDVYSTARDRYRLMKEEESRLLILETELADLHLKRATSKTMIAAWSPESGVLSKYFYNAVVRITELMNRYIDLVWSYPMRVLPCDLTDGDMDYLFGMKLKDHAEPVPDVSRGSKAQKVMVNLAFRITAYKAMGLTEYPILFDEPSEGMDDLHRAKLVNFIKHLITSGEFSQTILVSHDQDVHYKFNDAEFCVVEPEGVTLPEVYNRNVTIKYLD